MGRGRNGGRNRRIERERERERERDGQKWVNTAKWTGSIQPVVSWSVAYTVKTQRL